MDPQNIENRVDASGQPPDTPRHGESVSQGLIGFMLVSLGRFAPMVLAGRWFYRKVGETGMHAVCAVVFFGLSGSSLRRLIIGSDSLVRFCQIFSLAFVIY